MKEKIDLGKQIQTLNNFKLPLIVEKKKMRHFDKEIKNINECMTLLEKEIFNIE